MIGHWAAHHVPSDMASHTVRIGTSTLLQWKPKNSHFTFNYLINFKGFKKKLNFSLQVWFETLFGAINISCGSQDNVVGTETPTG